MENFAQYSQHNVRMSGILTCARVPTRERQVLPTLSPWHEGCQLFLSPQLTATRSDAMQIQEFLTDMIKRGGSDAHLKVGMPPGIRINGKITQVGDVPLTGSDTQDIAKQVLDPEKWQKFEYCGDLDTSYSVPGVARFRVNVMRQRGAVS